MSLEAMMSDDRKLRGKGPSAITDMNIAIARPKPKAAKFVPPVVAELPPVLAAEPVFAASIVEPVPPIVPAQVEPIVIEPVLPEPVAPEPIAPQSIAPEPTIETKPANPEPKKVFAMNETITNMQSGATDAIKSGAENAMSQGKATLEQVTAKSREAIEQGMKSIDEMTTMARGNVEALLASTKAATSGLESIAHQVADFSRKSFEETTAAARAMTTVKTPNELMQLQNDFAKTQFDAAISEMSKLSETLVKLAGEVFEPVQGRVALATDKIKSVAASTFKN
jgi:phasin family protein